MGGRHIRRRWDGGDAAHHQGPRRPHATISGLFQCDADARAGDSARHAGVALLEGRKGINWFIIGKTVFGWIITLVIVGFSTAAFFAQGAYAPMKSYPCYITGSC